MDKEIRRAINNKKLVQFYYDNQLRIGEPQILGLVNKAKPTEALLIWQLDGQSNSGRLPDWKMCYLDKIDNFQVLEHSFSGARGNGSNSKFFEIYTVVQN